ncbi:MAG TPA: glycoside hydrolase [Acidimicrobiia bacterium]|nr:glycoside hydrolase [Acidimicrobiia bacterium]
MRHLYDLVVHRALGVCIAVAAMAAACSVPKAAAPPASTTSATVEAPAGLTVALVSATAAQRIDGFGASGAWWPNDLAKFPPAEQKLVADKLFGPDGIALSAYRYNIGGGGAGVRTPARAAKQLADDTAGLIFLRAANDAHVPILTGFVNSAPPRFTTSGKACGGALKPGAEDAYAQYLAGIVEHLHDDEHITLQFVSPMNEPDNNFGDCGQEGMSVPVSQRATVVRALAKALARHAHYAKVIADETTADAILAAEAPQWLGVPGTKHDVAAIAHHTYDFPDDALRRLVPPIAARFGKPTWMTEICCYKGSGGVATSFGAQYDPTMTQGFWLADQVYSDLTVAGDSAWYWWTALSPFLGCDPRADPQCPTRKNTSGWNDGLLYYDEHYATSGVTQIFPTKRYSVLGQFSRYVRPGACRHAVTGAPAGVRMLAFAEGDRWVVVAWNEGANEQSLGIALPSGKAAPAEATATFTNEHSDLTRGATPVRTNTGSWLVTLPPGTIATYTFG